MGKSRGRKSKSKFAFDFEEFSELVEKLDKAGGDIPTAVENALTAAHGYITPQLEAGISRHIQTGATKRSLQTTAAVVWDNPLRAHIRIGFRISDGGLPSIFLMRGTPKMKPDTKLKSAAFGAQTKREVVEIQRQELEKILQEITGGDV